MKKTIIPIILFLNFAYSQMFATDTSKFVNDWNFSMQNVSNWGYNYDSLYIDLDIWRNSPYVMIDSIGASVQNRALWRLTITDAVKDYNPQFRIAIHARTHPNEVYSFYTTRAIIGILLGNTELAEKLRKYIIFNIIPIYNPDGVELEKYRENANGVDLERDWDSPNPQPESAALKTLYLSYMNSDYPIDIMLNMHNASTNFTRYFVYHHENGTSATYAQMEKDYIGNVHSYWEDGIEDWDAYVSWTNNTPTYFPESWFWFNYGEDVLALTYEDTRVSTGGDFHRAAEALLKGIYDYLNIADLAIDSENKINLVDAIELLPAYPNPFNPSTNIRYGINTDSRVTMNIYDINGKLICTPFNQIKNQGWYTFEWNGTNGRGEQVPAGIYLCKIATKSKIETNKLTLLR